MRRNVGRKPQTSANLAAFLHITTTSRLLSVLREDNRATLRRGFPHVMYLRASPDEIFKRIKHDRTRPLLQVDDPLARLRDLYRARDPLYREAAHYVIETGRPTVQTLVNMIMMQLEMAAPGDPV